MKKKFSTKWKASKQPRKQRKYKANAPLHIKHRMMSVNLSKTLRTKHGKRNIPVRKGDSVKILRGEFKGKSGKIESINLKRSRAIIEGIFRSKKDGTKVSVYLAPSNLQIQELNLDDKKRKQSLERKNATPSKPNVKTEQKTDQKTEENKKEKFKAKPLPKTKENKEKK